VYYFLTEATINRLVKELRDFWATHPKYTDLVANIQGKYAFENRPQHGIIVKVGSANHVRLAADNFIGTGQSYVALARVVGYNGTSCEWVREDALAIQANNGVFPTPAGVYYVEMTADDEFYVDSLLDVRGERVTMTSSTEGVLQQVPYSESLRLIEVPSGRLYLEGTDYTIGTDGVSITLTSALPSRCALSATYRYTGETTGPWEAKPRMGYNKAIPGVVLVFGNRGVKGDRFAVLVDSSREDSHLEYGGKWDLSIDMDIIARDPYAQREIADMTAMFLWSKLRTNLIDQGLDITEVSMGGETEEVYDENADDYFYNSSMSMTLQTDWFLYIPLAPRILTIAETLVGLPSGLQLEACQDPFYGVRFQSFPTVK
jgi:hypothetical protein